MALPSWPRPVSSTGVSIVRFVIVLSLLAVLWGAATLLTGAAHAQRVRRGTRAAAEAEAALASGQPAVAVAQYREAVALEPDHADYRLALARALAADGQFREAIPYVQEVLRAEPVRGPANLVLARLLQATGDEEEAEAAYYRAIFGRWPGDQQGARQRARLELVGLFEARGDRARLRTALIELAAAFPGDLGLQHQAARKLADAGMLGDAASVLSGIVERFADPGDALTRLAEVEAGRGQHVAAFDAARRALARDPADRDARIVRDRMARVLTLDPTLPRLTAADRRRRVRSLVQHARARLDACPSTPEGGGANADLIRSLDGWLARRGADVEVGLALLGAAARDITAHCPRPTEDNPADVVIAALVAGDVA